MRRRAAVVVVVCTFFVALSVAGAAETAPVAAPTERDTPRRLRVPLVAEVPVIAEMPAVSELDEPLLHPLPADLAFDKTPLHEVLDHLHSLTKVPFDLDRERVNPSIPVTANPGGLPLVSAVSDIVRTNRLTWLVRDGAVHVTAGGQANKELLTRSYEVVDLIDPADEKPLFRFLGEASWPLDSRSVRGYSPLEITVDPRTVVAGSTHPIVVEGKWWRLCRTARLLAILRRLRSMPPGERVALSADGYWSDSPSAAAARAALDAPLRGPVVVGDKSLGPMLAALAAAAGVPIEIDTISLGPAAPETQVSDPGEVEGRTPAIVLERVLGDGGLTLDLARDRLAVTSADWGRHIFATAVYPIDDLLAAGFTFESLIELIEKTAVAPTLAGMPDDGTLAWRGGPIWVIEGGINGLAITQTTSGHRAIEMLLRILRGGANKGMHRAAER